MRVSEYVPYLLETDDCHIVGGNNYFYDLRKRKTTRYIMNELSILLTSNSGMMLLVLFNQL